ncbi:MAG: translation initiation factor eIF-2B [Nanoarchaeota archaeon]
MEFRQALKNIKTLKIQGAEGVATEAVTALYSVIKKSNAHRASQLHSELKKAAAELMQTRPTEPAMRNALRYVLCDLDKLQSPERLAKRVNEKIEEVLFHFNNSREKIIHYGAAKIKRGCVVFTHCHSSTVVAILKRAAKRNVSFSVHNTETRPLFQGRKTAKELAAPGINTTLYTEAGALYALKKADICLFGADAIQSDGRVVNKTGTGLFAEIAHKYDIPVYVCMNSWKFDPKTIRGVDEVIEQRDRKEVWSGAPKKIKICNPAFEVVEPHKITAVISELGVYRPEVFPEIAERSYPFIK